MLVLGVDRKHGGLGGLEERLLADAADDGAGRGVLVGWQSVSWGAGGWG